MEQQSQYNRKLDLAKEGIFLGTKECSKNKYISKVTHQQIEGGQCKINNDTSFFSYISVSN